MDPVPTLDAEQAQAEQEAQLDAHLDQLVAQLPPLNDEQLDHLAAVVASIRLRAQL